MDNKQYMKEKLCEVCEEVIFQYDDKIPDDLKDIFYCFDCLMKKCKFIGCK